MKEYLKNIYKTPMVFVFILTTIIYGFNALGMTAEINRYAIVSAIGIDSSDDEESKFEISLLTFIPIAEQTFTETYKVVSAKGKSLSEAMDFAGLHIGREVGLSHVKLIVLNEGLVHEDVTKFLDYLSRSRHMSSSTKLVITDSTAKEFLQVAEQLDSQSSIKVSELITYNNEYIYATDSTLETFFKGLFGPTRVSLVPYIILEDESTSGFAVSSSGGSGNGNGGTQSKTGQAESSQEKKIVNNGDTIVFKDAVEKVKISGKDIEKINLIRGDFNTGTIDIENFSDENFDEANLTFEIFDKRLRNKVTYQNGIPIFQIDMELSLTLTEVENKNGMIEENVEFFTITPEALEAIEQKVRKSVMEGVEIMRDNQIDVIDFYTIMHNSDKKSFNKFLSSLEDEDNYLSHMVFKVSVKVYSK